MNNNLLIQQNEEQFIIEEQIQQVQVRNSILNFNKINHCLLFQTDVIEINHIMRDIGAIVSEQSPIIAAIEQNVSAANDNIVAANQQLAGASNSQVNLPVIINPSKLLHFF
jgi:t-SNARE complex subunit (syntaxin)